MNNKTGIVNTMSFSEFCDGWPESRRNSFSYAGKRALYDYLENLSDEIGESIEYDPIALDCEFTEYSSAFKATQNYNFEPDTDGTDAEDQEKEALEWLEYRTQVILVDGGGVIIAEF